MPRGRPIDRNMVNAIQLLSRAGFTPREVREEIGRLWPAGVQLSMAVVYKWIRAMPDSQERDRWTPGMAEASTDEDALVLEVLAHVIHETSGRRSHFTVDEARAIGRIRRLAPAVVPFEAFALAHEYLMLTDTDAEGRAAVDAYLAYRSAHGDRGGDWRTRYGMAVWNGWIPPGPFWWNIEDEQWRLRIFGGAGREGHHG